MSKDIEMAKQIATLVKQAGGQTYYVGGCVRDFILNKENKDVDIEIHGITPDVLKDILRSLGTMKTFGASFGVYSLNGYDIDISQPRSERPTGMGHKDFEIYVDAFMGTKKAAQRRDFTINAIMQDVLTGKIVDHFHGVDDINDKIIHHVDSNTFVEDPLRVFRAAQFSARLGFSVFPETIELMREINVSTLSKERVYTELEKTLLKSTKPSTFFQVLSTSEKLHDWFPEFENQNLRHMFIDKVAPYQTKASNPAYYMMTALCMDIYNKDENIKEVDAFLDRLNPDVHLRKYIHNMLPSMIQLTDFYHIQAESSITNHVLDKSINIHDLISLTSAFCVQTHHVKIKDILNWCNDRKLYYETIMQNEEVKGQDLISLGIEPSERFSIILHDTHQLYLAGIEKEKVLELVRQSLKIQEEYNTKLLPTFEQATQIRHHQNQIRFLENTFARAELPYNELMQVLQDVQTIQKSIQKIVNTLNEKQLVKQTEMMR